MKKEQCVHWSPAGGYTQRGFAALDLDKERCPWCLIGRYEHQISEQIDEIERLKVKVKLAEAWIDREMIESGPDDPPPRY